MAPALRVIAFLSWSSIALALELPSFTGSTDAVGTDSAAAARGSDWWVRLNDQVYHAPPSSFIGLSSNVSDYYTALGPDEALPEELRRHRVGGQGRLHLFHLPKEGGSLIQSAMTAAKRSELGNRRSSLSRLQRLQGGEVLTDTFPAYAADATYVNPLDAAGKKMELKAADFITTDLLQNYLEKLVNLNSRSYADADKNSAAVKLVHAELAKSAPRSARICQQDFEAEGKTLTNVIAFVPGSSQKTVVVGAHYDSRPFEGAAPGAEDNGIGVAAMLSVAKALQASGAQPLSNMYFVGFAGEEAGLYGSDHFAEALKAGSLPERCSDGLDAPGDVVSRLFDGFDADKSGTPHGQSFLFTRAVRRLRGRMSRPERKVTALIMDEIGWRSDKLARPTVNFETYDWSNPVLQHLAAACRDHNGDNIDIQHSNVPFGSDHMSFLNRGMEASLLINGDDQRYPFYHTSDDTIKNVNYDLAQMITKTVLGAALRSGGVAVS